MSFLVYLIEWIRHIVTSGLCPSLRLNPTWLAPDVDFNSHEYGTTGISSGNADKDFAETQPNRDEANYEQQDGVDSRVHMWTTG